VEGVEKLAKEGKIRELRAWVKTGAEAAQSHRGYSASRTVPARRRRTRGAENHDHLRDYPDEKITPAGSCALATPWATSTSWSRAALAAMTTRAKSSSSTSSSYRLMEIIARARTKSAFVTRQHAGGRAPSTA